MAGLVLPCLTPFRGASSFVSPAHDEAWEDPLLLVYRPMARRQPKAVPPPEGSQQALLPGELPAGLPWVVNPSLQIRFRALPRLSVLRKSPVARPIQSVLYPPVPTPPFENLLLLSGSCPSPRPAASPWWMWRSGSGPWRSMEGGGERS